MKRIKPTPLSVSSFPIGKRTDLYVPLSETGIGRPVEVPFIVVRGAREGPTLGLTAVVHGNELNGIRIIHHLLQRIPIEELCGSLVCVPIVNVPSFLLGQRYFVDSIDLNSCFPGNAQGTPSQQYAKAFSSVFLPCCDYLVDIHTASEGRLNSLYVRVDVSSPDAFGMAMSFNPEIILNSKAGERTLRNAARSKGVPAITVEAGNPSVVQGRMVAQGEQGILNVIRLLGMLTGDEVTTRKPVICSSSQWLRTTTGGLLDISFGLRDQVEKKQVLAESVDPFGKITKRYQAPHNGIVIGMASDPVSIPGMRYCHLGTIKTGT